MSPIRFGSLFSGIGSASVAWRSLGWTPAWFAETDPFASRVLAHHWPATPNLGDVTADDFVKRADRVDLIVGGSPCQSWSQAGQRGGLDDPRGQLTPRFFEIVAALRPRWFIWENVPGVLSHDDGKPFAEITDRAKAAGYDLTHRTLDARRFGLPHSRVRLFVVGRLGSGAGDALFAAREHSPADIGDGRRPPGRRARMATAACGVAIRTRDEGTVAELSADAHCLTGGERIAANYVWDGTQIREFTPTERERLLGLPDGWTDISKATVRDRIRVTGNTMPVPVVRWIGENIDRAERLQTMSPIERLERKILERLPQLNFRPTLDRVAEVGGYIAEAKSLLPHGDFIPWLKRVGVHRRSAADYMAVFRYQSTSNERPGSQSELTIKQFLRRFRDADRAERQRQRDDARAAVAATPGVVPELFQADATKFKKWPKRIDCICTDPPWADLDAYKWLAGFCGSRLREGGIVLVQVGNAYLPEVLDMFRAAGLTYVWCLSLVHKQGQDLRPTNGPNGGRFVSFLRPILFLSRGKPDLPNASVTDVLTIHHTIKTHHEWEQPLAPWLHLLERLCLPGSTIVDPFCGSATTGVAARKLGHNWLGVEIDAERANVARGRLAQEAVAKS